MCHMIAMVSCFWEICGDQEDIRCVEQSLNYHRKTCKNLPNICIKQPLNYIFIFNHIKNIEYGAIKQLLSKSNILNPSIKEISEAIIEIRQSKLPDPNIIGNSGSFFKNPIIKKEVFDKFIKKHPKAPFYIISETEIKIPAGWLIEKAGFKGIRFGDAGVHEKQALVLVNYGNASGTEILNLAFKIQNAVKEQFGITIVPEVNVI